MVPEHYCTFQYLGTVATWEVLAEAWIWFPFSRNVFRMVCAICRSLPLFRFAGANNSGIVFTAEPLMRRRSLRLESPRVFRGSNAMNLYPTADHWTNGKITFRDRWWRRESHHFDWIRVYLRNRLGFLEGARDDTVIRCEHKSHFSWHRNFDCSCNNKGFSPFSTSHMLRCEHFTK
jgi:hypothetical protein